MGHLRYSNENDQIQNLHRFENITFETSSFKGLAPNSGRYKCESRDKHKILENRFDIDIAVSFVKFEQKYYYALACTIIYLL